MSICSLTCIATFRLYLSHFFSFRILPICRFYACLIPLVLPVFSIPCVNIPGCFSAIFVFNSFRNCVHLVIPRYLFPLWGRYLGIRRGPRLRVTSLSFSLVLSEKGASFIQNSPLLSGLRTASSVSELLNSHRHVGGIKLRLLIQYNKILLNLCKQYM